MPAWSAAASEVDLSVRMRVDPQRGLDRAAAILGEAVTGLRRLPDATSTKRAANNCPISSSADIAAAFGRGLRQFAEHHQFRQRRNASDLPDLGAIADRLHQFRLQEKRQAFVAADMVVVADEFAAGMADQHRSRDQLEGAAAGLVAEAALAHIGDRMAAVPFRERRVAGHGVATEVGHRNRRALQQGR